MNWNSPAIRALVKLGLDEDAARHDITTQTLIPAQLTIEAVLRSKETGVICGLPLAVAFFKKLDPQFRFSLKVKEGQAIRQGTLLASLRGKARAILSAERSALNALQHLSGIATFTHQQVRRLDSRRTALYDTRKTLPGWRELQKYAVRCGGGKNHRMTLQSSVLIKDNHLMLCRLIKKDWIEAVRKLRKQHPDLPVELEVQTSQDLHDLFKVAPGQVLLDNMSQGRLKSMLKLIRSRLPRTEIEVSGGVREDQLRALGKLGVDRISMGRLTHSAPALDVSLDITHVYQSR